MTICIDHDMLVRLDTDADLAAARALAEAFAEAGLDITVDVLEEEP